MENESSGLINHELKEHMECCPECCALYKEKLDVKASFNELFNRPDKNFIPQNNKILSELNPKYYKKSLRSKIAYHLRRNKFTYSTAIAFTALLIFTLPVMKSYMGNSYNTSKLNSGSTANSKNTTTVRDTTNGTIIFKTDIKRKNFDGKLLEIADPKKIAVGYSFGDSQTAYGSFLLKSKGDKTTSEIAKSVWAVAAINGGATVIDADTQNNIETMKTHSGIAIHDGKVVFSDINTTDAVVNLVGFNQEGLLISGIYNTSKINELGIKEGITSPLSFSLIDKGKPTQLESKPISEPRGPRTVIGQKANGAVLMLVINGRNADCIGATLSEVQNILLEFGAYTAVYLSGGTSSSMYYNGEIINNPCAPSGEQKVPSVFMVMP